MLLTAAIRVALRSRLRSKTSNERTRRQKLLQRVRQNARKYYVNVMLIMRYFSSVLPEQESSAVQTLSRSASRLLYNRYLRRREAEKLNIIVINQNVYARSFHRLRYHRQVFCVSVTTGKLRVGVPKICNMVNFTRARVFKFLDCDMIMIPNVATL